jgi:hypothetical protein
VGQSGQVVATDIDVSYLQRLDLPNLEVHRHNIVEDPLEVLAPSSFDLVCSRLMLFWLAGKQEVAIRRMVECYDRGDGLLMRTATGARLRQCIPPTRNTRATTTHGGVANGGQRAGMTLSLGGSSRRYLSTAAWRTSAMRRVPKWCAAAACGQAGGGRAWRAYVPPSTPKGA